LFAEIGQPLGEPSRPLDDAGLNAKFHLLADPVLGSGPAARVIDAVWALEDVAHILTLVG
jgi:hypothetical protein